MQFHPVPDYHMHTPRCNHAIGNVAEYADAALAIGLREIGISDHSPMPGDYDRAWRMDRSELAGYIEEVEAVRERFAGRLAVKLGLEADFHPGTESYVREMIDGHAWDYVIGSVHYIGDWGFDNPDDMSRWQSCDVEDAYCSYFELVAASAEADMFDIIGHPDLIKKFGHRPPAGSRRVAAAEKRMLEAIRASGAAMEISSAGLRKPVAEVYPHGRLIAAAAAMGIPFSFGSDAHAPGEVGHAMEQCLAMLKACGVNEVVSFSGRRQGRVVLEPVRG